MRVKLSRFIKPDLEAIADWIAEDNPRRAVSFIREIREAFTRISKDPEIYQLRPDIGDQARLLAVGRYVILFWIDDNVVRIERVVQGNRQLPQLFEQ